MIEKNGGARWTPQIVEARLAEAFKLDAALPDGGPRGAKGTACALTRAPIVLEIDLTESAADEDQIADLHKIAAKLVRDDPSWFGTMCEAFNELPVIEITADQGLRMDEALEWIAKLEVFDRLEQARLKVLSWFRRERGLSTAAHCASKGIRPTDLVRAKATYFAALAARLNAGAEAPQAARAARPRYSVDIVFGAGSIAREVSRSEVKTLRLIDGGKLPVGKLGGELCASRAMLARHRTRPTAKMLERGLAFLLDPPDAPVWAKAA
jgi:hypothetical protein